MDYGKIVTRALEITCLHRALWLFGILLALFESGSGIGNANVNVPSDISRGLMDALPHLPEQAWQLVSLAILALVCWAIVWLVLAIVLRFICRAALIGLVQELEADQKTPTVRRGFRIGMEHFGRLFGIALVINIPLAIISLVIIGIALLPFLMAIVPLMAAGRSAPEELLVVVLSGGVFSLVLVCCAGLVLFALNLVIQPFYQFITRACVIQKIGVFDSIRTGYRLVRVNVSKVAVLYILALGIRIGFGLLILPVVLLLLAITAGVSWAVYAITQAVAPALVAAVGVGIPMLLILIFISGLYATFESTYWTLGYRAVTG